MKCSIEKSVQILGGQSALARLIGVSQPAVHKWRKTGIVPVRRAISIARATGWEITPHDLRPDVFPNPTDGMPVDESPVSKVSDHAPA